MGIVAFCPQGHRVKVKDQLAGRKGICPTCGTRFRIPPAAAVPPAAPAPLPVATIISLDAAIAARLPRALPLHEPAVAAGRPPATAPATAPVTAATVTAADSAADDSDSFAAEAEEHEPRMHPVIAERPDLAWCLAVPGGTASEPLTSDALQAWLDARRATGVELVWRADWPDWRPIARVFPESVPARRG
jgi:hypothetical protein